MSEGARPVVVFDCMTFLQAAISPTGPAAACIRLVEAGVVQLVISPVVFSYARDPKDEPYLNLAIAVAANFLVSRDNDLLDLMKEDSPDGRVLRERCPGLAILDPVAFLQQFASASGENPVV